MNFLRKLFGQRILNIYHLATAIVANLIYGFPSRKLRVIGVTGTDGKTTTVNLIASILQTAGHKTSFLSSINARIGSREYDTGLHTTTPSPFLLQRLMKKMAAAGSEFCVLEVTSHALDQYRVWGIRFEIAVLTNITPEHLDYHKTFAEYARVKIKLFSNAESGILNAEDQNDSIPKSIKIVTYGAPPKAQIWADQISEDLRSTKFVCHIPNSTFSIQSNLPGRFNILNSLAAIGVGQLYNIKPDAMKAGLEKVKNVSGRLQLISEGQSFYAMVDFAHTANALRNLLGFLRPKIGGKIIVVFGCAGERDVKKRPEMGKVADELADIIIITREDNRSEDIHKICEAVAAGITRKQLNQGYFIIPDRREAIRFALRHVGHQDLVVATGKGHEQSLNIDGKEVPWDDRSVMREELKKVVSHK